MGDKCSLWLSPGVRLRREYFGGIAFDKRNGNIIEVDKSAFQFLNIIKNGQHELAGILSFLRKKNIIRKHEVNIYKTVLQLLELGIIKERQASDESTKKMTIGQTYLHTRNQWLSAPETVHWAVTYRCKERCPDCYVSRFKYSKTELNTRDCLKLINKIADLNVFQLSIGGGEPFIREDLPEIVNHAASRDLSVNLTTGMLEIDPVIIESMSESVKSLQIGIRANQVLGDSSGTIIRKILQLLDLCKKLGINTGANIFLNRSTLEHLESLIEVLATTGIDRIIFLRYKPPGNLQQWQHELPSLLQMVNFGKTIKQLLEKHPLLNIRIDCALSFMQKQAPVKLAIQHGIRGCVAASRIIAIAPDGDVFPCSQLIHSQCNAGNLLNSDPAELWNNSKILSNYRSFRTKETFMQSVCGICKACDICGGCRVFAEDAMGGDPYCPEFTGSFPDHGYPEWILNTLI